MKRLLSIFSLMLLFSYCTSSSDEHKEKNENDELSLKETKIKIRQIKRYIESIKESISKLEQTKHWIEEESDFFYQTYKKIGRAHV